MKRMLFLTPVLVGPRLALGSIALSVQVKATDPLCQTFVYERLIDVFLVLNLRQTL